MTREKKIDREKERLSRRVGTGFGWGRKAEDETVRVRDERTGAVRRRYRRAGTIVAFGQIINPEVLTFFAS